MQDPTYDGAFRQGLALAALSMVTPTPATVDPGAGSIADLPAVSWLLDQQCDDGSWQPIRTIPLTPCAFNPVTFSGPETNTTALAMLGLHAVGATPNIDPISWLNSVREADGGWSYDGNGPSDPSSTGLVIGARRALGIAPDTAAIATLRSMQNIVTGVGNFDRGGFSYPGSAVRRPAVVERRRARPRQGRVAEQRHGRLTVTRSLFCSSSDDAGVAGRRTERGEASARPAMIS